mgnify:FL=1
MKVKQISAFVENAAGNLADVITLLGKNDINISAMSLADTTDFGIVRMIVSDTQKAVDILKEQGFAVKCTEVTALALDDTPGGLAKVLEILKSENIGIEYLYAFVGKKDHRAMVVMRVSEPEKAETLFGDEFSADLTDIYHA